MKTIGLIGDMSWESTAICHRLLNEIVRERLGGLHSAKLLLFSFNFAEIEAMQASDDRGRATKAMIAAAKRLEAGGADCVVICTNTMHKTVAEIAAAVDLPLLHIADATADACKAQAVNRPLLLATRYTMEQDFYRGRLGRRGVEAIVPDDAGRTVIHDVIYQELCLGVVRDESREAYKRVVGRGVKDGADGVIFGCTEVGMLLSAADVPVPAFDTTRLHAKAAVRFALDA